MAYTPIGEKDLIFIDTETTGLEPRIHEVIEIAIIRVNLKLGTRIIYETKIKPQHIETASPKALEVNGYTEEAWAKAPYLGEIAREIVELLKDGIIVGHNVSFDTSMISGALKEIGIESRLSHHRVDTVGLSFVRLVPLGLESLSLDAIREFLGWSKEGAHTALKDAEDAEKLFFLLEHYSWRSNWQLKRMISKAAKSR